MTTPPIEVVSTYKRILPGLNMPDWRAVDIPAETKELRERLTDKYGADLDVSALAAIGITALAWRNDWNGEVEEAHTVRVSRDRTRITDGEMFAANVANTRLVLEHLRFYPDVDWEALADTFTDPQRTAGRRTLVDLLGTTRHRRWTRWARPYISAIGLMVKKYGPEYALLAQASVPGVRADWWAGPLWPGLVDAFINQLTEQPPGMAREELRTALLATPDKMDPEILEWCATDQLIGYTRTN